MTLRAVYHVDFPANIDTMIKSFMASGQIAVVHLKMRKHSSPILPTAVCFLETWIDKGQGDDVSLHLIADTLFDLWKRFKRSKEFEGLYPLEI